MTSFILSRLAQALVTLLFIATLVFFITRLSGDPLDVILGEYVPDAARAALAAKLGLDQPLPVQYWVFLSHAVRGDFGISIRTQRPALELFLERLPATLQLGAAAISVSTLIGVSAGVYSARRRGTLPDALVRLLAMVGLSIPSFWLGIILILIFGVWLRVLPTGGAESPSHVILPAITMGWVTAAGLMRITRSSMLEVLNTEYIKLARAKGLGERTVIWKHAFKNALIPVLTFWSILFVLLLTGAVVTETVFSWPGVGRLAITAVTWRDFPVVQTVVIFLGSMYILVNLAVDILYGYLNPKTRKR